MKQLDLTDDVTVRFERMVASKQLGTERFEITPELAERMLERNHHNRPIRQSVVAHYVNEIIRGHWLTSSQGIAFDWNGVLRDGQHRLRAIVEAQCPVSSFVAFGLDPKAVDFIDTGTRRSVGAILEEEFGTGKGSIRAAICTVIMQKFHRAAEVTKSTAEIFRVYRTIEPSIDWVIGNYTRLRSINATAPHMSALVLYREFSPDQAELFLDRIVNRVSNGKTDPAEKFREACQIKTPRGGAGLRQDQFQRGCNCVAAFHQNREVTVLTSSEVGLKFIWVELARVRAPLFKHLERLGRGNERSWS